MPLGQPLYVYRSSCFLRLALVSRRLSLPSEASVLPLIRSKARRAILFLAFAVLPRGTAPPFLSTAARARMIAAVSRSRD